MSTIVSAQRLNDLILRHEKDLLRFCCVYLQDAALAQDAVQETFLKAYRSLHRFRGDCSEKTWLLRIAVNVCRDMQSSAWHRHADRRVTLENLPSPSAPPDENGKQHAIVSSPLIELSSRDEFISITEGSEYLMPTDAFWNAVSDEYCNVSIQCRGDGTYELIEQTTIHEDMEMFRYMPSADSAFVYTLCISDWGGLDGSSITWRAQYWTSTDGMGFNVEDYQQYTVLDVPGMTNAIAVTSYDKTTIYMRKVLDEPLAYIPVQWMFDPESHADEAPWLLDEIYYEITATGISPETVLTWIPST